MGHFYFALHGSRSTEADGEVSDRNVFWGIENLLPTFTVGLSETRRAFFLALI